jgi:hypothetical protein
MKTFLAPSTTGSTTSTCQNTPEILTEVMLRTTNKAGMAMMQRFRKLRLQNKIILMASKKICMNSLSKRKIYRSLKLIRSTSLLHSNQRVFIRLTLQTLT